ncbi:hypothetical protein PoB_001059400 [Plakobranchus ocellatus]|uniref:Ig-like domain-containing protein n=1 Tax=Plakobranchus ocellatus TaxID=259542 RepID=A0AAV3YM42_9GAST|nr:hypothetical protein PoB_001059400 [Plakobranchus ocellatus]
MNPSVTLILVVWILIYDQGLALQCEPVEEGKSHTFTCSGGQCTDPKDLIFQWTVVGGSPSKVRVISSCDSTLSCTGNNANFTNTVQSRSSDYYSSVTVHKTSLDQPYEGYTWVCDLCGTRSESCTLQVYVKPVNPTCHASEILNDVGVLTAINLTCTMDRVYPQGQCLFQTIAQNGSISSISSSPNGCQRTHNIGNLKTGENKFQAKVGSSRQPNFHLIEPTPVLPSIYLRLPRTRIVCPNSQYKDGFYKGDILRCNCEMTDPGKPQGRPRWWLRGIPLDILFPQLLEQEGVLRVAYHGFYDPNDEFTCYGISAIGQELPGNKFSPKFAFLRTGRIDLSTNDSDVPVDICCGNPGVSVHCNISASDVSPTPKVVLLVDDNPTSAFEQGTDRGGMYQHSFTFRPNFGGVYRVGCRVENAIFADLKDDKTSLITIHSPVQFAGVSEIQETFETKTDPGSTATIMVDITAYPGVNSSTLYRGRPEENTTVQYSSIQYRSRGEIAEIRVEMTLRIDSVSDLASYTLVMDNGIGDQLEYTFSLEEETDDDALLLPVLVGTGSGVLLLVLIIIVVCWRRRRTKSSNSENEDQACEIKANDDEPQPAAEEHENVYSNPLDEEEDHYEQYVDSIDSVPTVQAPSPPKTAPKNVGKTPITKDTTSSRPTPPVKPKPNPPTAPKPAKSNAKKSQPKKDKQEKQRAKNVKIRPGATGVENVENEKQQRPDAPPPRPPPRKPEDEGDYMNLKTLLAAAASANYDVTEPIVEEREYLQVQEGRHNSAGRNSGIDNQEDNYYSAINDGPNAVLY